MRYNWGHSVSRSAIYLNGLGRATACRREHDPFLFETVKFLISSLLTAESLFRQVKFFVWRFAQDFEFY